MRKLHYLDLDGRSLRLLLSLLETRSATATARQTGLTQSAVSHALERLRGVLGDPLFVRAGRGLEPTEHALSLAPLAREALTALESMGQEPAFDPATSTRKFVIAANDYQRDMVLPPVFHRLQQEAPGVRLRIKTSGNSGGEMLRNRDCDLLITPKGPDYPDLMRSLLYEDRMACFYDPACRPAPETLPDYLAARHVTVVYGDDEATAIDAALAQQGHRRQVVLQLPNFSALPAFLRGSDLVVATMELSRHFSLAGFGVCPLPFPVPLLSMHMIWHVRDTASPAHRWLRDLIRSTVHAACPNHA
ncbi:LysR family transcriptional regulator [Novispirillum itersonii]|uniref:DNA-binding transcriptional LysR family regulator n=1 Tax=Novispirillum itersonii TaxID=189 RepID=A0A7W9ZFF0_NOVIT|nr:LysR family transcriptional regulator [Novispirillum itersonii]MBB6210430.1 DNA-binding transcriptional LysR family regulator [Novispirillum itersonii]